MGKKRRERLRFLVGDRVRVRCEVLWTDDEERLRLTRPPALGVVKVVTDYDSTTIFEIWLDSGGEFQFEERKNGRVVELA